MKTFKEIALQEALTYKINLDTFDKDFSSWESGKYGKKDVHGDTTIYYKDNEKYFSLKKDRLTVLAQGKQLFQIIEMGHK